MKNKANQENQQKKTVKISRVQIWRCAVSIVLCIAFAAIIFLGAVTYKVNGKNNALRADLNGVKEALEAFRGDFASVSGELSQMKNDYAQLKAELEAFKNENQGLSQRVDALEEENKNQLQEIEDLKAQLPIPIEEKIRIYIDQGHNPVPYHNSGAAGNDLYEHDLTFVIGCALAELLKADGRFEICLSRPNKGVVLGTDNASSHEARVEGAKTFEADYLISLHVNSYTDGSPNGIEVYTVENDTLSRAFGESLLEGLVGSTGLRDRGMKQNPDLYILKNATMPAALLEMGFISNSGDAAVLAEHPELFAQGIYDGILDYFGLSPRNTAAN